MFNLYFIFNGHKRTLLGCFYNIHDAVDEVKEHVYANSAITHPRYSKSMSGDCIRIDYGAKDCYYTIEKK